MSIKLENPVQIRKSGLEALYKALGPIGMIRFLQQYETGEGDYTRDRETWLHDLDTKTILKEIKSKKRKTR
jgi:hypothetical protein